MVITPDGHLLGGCEGDSSEDLVRYIHGVAPVAELDADEVGYLVAKVAVIKRQR